MTGIIRNRRPLLKLHEIYQVCGSCFMYLLLYQNRFGILCIGGLPKTATNGSGKSRNACYRHQNSENDFYKIRVHFASCGVLFLIGQAFIRTMVPVIRRIKPVIRKSNEVIRTWMDLVDAFDFFSKFRAEKMCVSFI